MDYHSQQPLALGGPPPPCENQPPGSHWNYAPPPPPSWQNNHHPNTRSQRHAQKRAREMSESDDDAFSEESGKEQCTSPGDADSCQMMSRKKRRGVIEKKRRDRINCSLTELKRLVPSALEKQGSAKLEKAEILQLTVDHLKMLHAKGVDTFAYDPQRYAMDYHNIGFRECASEVARYLVSCEGLDIQDPLRLRLMSHLQCFAAQRELATKSSSYPHTYPHTYPPQVPQSYPEVYGDTSGTAPVPAMPPVSSAVSYAPPPPTVPSHIPPTSYHHTPPTSASHHQYTQGGGGSKPYRPWGAEVAY